jgi:cytochrome c oxidase accessory protein FixG
MEPYKNVVYEDTEAYRDTIATVDKKGKRIWLFPKKPIGAFYNARTVLSWVYLAIFLIFPFLKYNGNPLFLFNVLERKFIFFGIFFSPQDFHLFALVMLTFMVFIILFTVVFGRLFCGWACPQTIFMEMYFRKIEYWIEGDGNQQKKLSQQPWTSEKIIKKTAKHFLFFLFSFLISNYFLAYIIGMDEVMRIISEPLSLHWAHLGGILLFSFIFYGVFAVLREQVCTSICPYGRLQGVLLVPESIVILYDFLRGEPRGKISTGKSENTTKGDCIDCNLCVAVCPTGIDIRNGTQLECVNCTACIDACDNVMEKIGRPKNLIRYDSILGVQEGKRKVFTPRVFAYSFVLLFLLSLDSYLLTHRTKLECIVLRSPGMLYQEPSPGVISNLYTYLLINKSDQPISFQMEIKDDLGKIRLVGDAKKVVPPRDKLKGVFFIDVSENKLTGRKTKVTVSIKGDKPDPYEVQTSFLGPNN